MVHLHAEEPGPQLLWARIVEYVQAEQRLGTVAPDVDPLIVAQVLFGVEHLSVLFGALGGDVRNVPPDVAPDQERLVAFLTRACAPHPPHP
jgi:hypothetical protein